MTYLKQNGQLSRESEERIRLALLADHDPYACPNTCDIAAAYRMGLVFVAAHLLYGATETPALDSLPEDLRERFTRPEPEHWEEWCHWHDTVAVECPECGAFAYPDGSMPTECGNCLASLES